jgi:hypothetical protein
VVDARRVSGHPVPAIQLDVRPEGAARLACRPLGHGFGHRQKVRRGWCHYLLGAGLAPLLILIQSQRLNG